MKLSYFSAFLLTLFFLTVKFLTEMAISVFTPASGEGPYSEWHKLLLTLSFIVPLIPVFLYSFLTGKESLLISDKENKKSAGSRGIQSLLLIFSVLFFLPVSIQILGTHIVWMTMTVFPCNDLYRNMAAFLEPRESIADTAGAFITVGFTGPWAEELFFRGILMTSLLRRYGNSHLIPVLIFQSLLFGASHMNMWQAGYAAAMGLVFGYIRIQSGGLVVPVAVHTANNLISLILLYTGLFHGTDQYPDPCDQIVPVSPDLLLLALVLMAGSLVIIRSNYAITEDGRTT